jgi:hypothetical protein
LQASEVLNQCLEEGRLVPLQSLVEMLVVLGPTSLASLREILGEVFARRSQVKNDQHQVFIKLENDLRTYHIRLGGVHSLISLARLTPTAFLAFLRSQNVENEKDQLVCLQRLEEALELIKSLEDHLRLLEEIEHYLHDWLWCLIYQSAHQEWGERSLPMKREQQIL